MTCIDSNITSNEYVFSSFNDVELPHSMLVECCMSCCQNVTTVAAMMIKSDCIFTCHKSANPKSDHKPTTYPTKYLCQYQADEDVSSNDPLPMYVTMLAV